MCSFFGSVSKKLTRGKKSDIMKEKTGEKAMAKIEVTCPYCKKNNVVKYGKSKTGVQRFQCRNLECSRSIFQLEYQKNAYKPGCKETIVKMAVNGAGTRDTGRVLKISPNTVTSVLKKTEKFAKPVNETYLKKKMKK